MSHDLFSYSEDIVRGIKSAKAVKVGHNIDNLRYTDTAAADSRKCKHFAEISR